MRPYAIWLVAATLCLQGCGNAPPTVVNQPPKLLITSRFGRGNERWRLTNPTIGTLILEPNGTATGQPRYPYHIKATDSVILEETVNTGGTAFLEVQQITNVSGMGTGWQPYKTISVTVTNGALTYEQDQTE